MYSNILNTLYNIPGYSKTFSCRDTSSGGLVVFIDKRISHTIIANRTIDGFHHIHAELNINGRLFDVHRIYRLPSFDFHEFCNLLEELLSLASSNRSCFIAGDVNVPMNLVNNNAAVLLCFARVLWLCTDKTW